jgi:DNA polymerase-3 subunit gamma/tau
VADTTLKGPAKELAAHAAFLGYDAGVLRLSLSPADEMLNSTASMKTLAQALAPAFGMVPQIRIEAAATTGETLHQRSTRERDARQEAAESAFLADPGVQQLIRQHGAQVVPDSIRPFDE